MELRPGNKGAVVLTNLTARELEVLKLIAQGLSNTEIAEKLVLSKHTVHVYVRNLYAKIGVKTRVRVALYAIKEGLT